MMEEKVSNITPSKMKERGWTPSMIRDILGDPDRTVPNPNYRAGPPMRLYNLARVEAAEKTDMFSSLRRKAAVRSKAGTAVADKKRSELIEEITNIKIQLRDIDIGKLKISAISSYNNYNQMRESHIPATVKSEALFLERIMVNYARHNLTIYDEKIDDLFARIGKQEAISIMRNKIYNAISEKWPKLAEECQRQKERRM